MQPPSQQLQASSIAATTTYVSDLKPTFVMNGWGSGHLDKSNGEQNDAGNTLSIRGKTYAKGLGVHANSEVDVPLDGKYSRFVSDIGVDDEKNGLGSVGFQVLADGKQIFDSGVTTGKDAVKHVDLDVSGKQKLQLIVNPGKDGISNDHADWADARLTPADKSNPGGLPQPNPTPTPPSSSKLDPAFHDTDLGVPNDAHPDGVPSSYDWYHSATPGWGNNPPADWHSLTAWGQIYAAEGWHPEQAPNTRVQIKDLQTWVLSKSTHQWSQVQSAPTVDGRAYASDFKNDASKSITAKDESNNGGGTSVTAGNGFNYHFWAQRANMNPTDIGGVYTKFEARLVLDNPSKPDDRAQAKYIANAGGDYWRSQDAQWAADWSNNGDISTGRFKTVTNDWKNFSMETLPADQLLKNPPPLT